MRVNLNQLHVFYLAARNGSMTAAARVLSVSTPAVTMQIKKLESWLGFPVFERGQGDLRLTERGFDLYTDLEPMFGGLEKLEQHIQELMQDEEAVLRLGTHHLPGNYFIPDLIAHVHRRYPELKVQMELGTQDKLLEKLYEQNLDLALIIGDVPDDGKSEGVRLFDEKLALVTSSRGKYAKVESLKVKDVAALPLILQQKGAGARQAVLDFLALHDIEPNILLDNLSSDVIKQFLVKMPSCAFISRFIVQKELDEGLFHEIKVVEGSPVSRFQLVYLASQYPPAKIKNFLLGVKGFSPRFETLDTDI